MLLRTLVAFSVVGLVAAVLPAEERMIAAKVGDTVIVSMTGDISKEYLRLSKRPGIPCGPGGGQRPAASAWRRSAAATFSRRF